MLLSLSLKILIGYNDIIINVLFYYSMMARKKVGLALGGGSFRGFAHVGVLKALEKHNISVDYIAGTSAGSIVGALYASGLSVKKIEHLIHTTPWKYLLDFVLPSKGFLEGKRIEQYIQDLIHATTFEDLRIPLRVVAADLKSGKEVVFHKGDVASAVRASMSIPVVFNPLERHGSILVDGGVINPVPVSVVKDMGADYVIAVDLSTPVSVTFEKGKPSRFNQDLKKTFVEQELTHLRRYLHVEEKAPIVQFFFNPVKVFDLFKGGGGKMALPEFLKYNVASFHLMVNELSKYKVREANVIIHPDFDGISPLDLGRSKLCIERGQTAARAMIPTILKDLKKK